METRALVVNAVNTVEVRSADVPEPGPGEVCVEVAYSGISPGTELRKMSGVEGDSFPYVPGYTMAGVIEAVGEGVSTVTVGTRVWCGGSLRLSLPLLWGGHVAHAIRPVAGVVALPDGVGLIEASIAKLAAIAYHGARLAHPLPHETVAVIGLGPIGQCAARIYSAMGVRTVAVDMSAERVALATQAGITALVPDGTLSQTVKRVFPHGVDVVVDCTGVNGVIPEALQCARDQPWNETVSLAPRYLVQGSYADGFTIPYDAAFRRELQILVPRNHIREDVVAVIELLARNRLTLRELVGDIREPEQAQATYDELRTSKGGLVTAAFRWAA